MGTFATIAAIHASAARSKFGKRGAQFSQKIEQSMAVW
jgi:hypothetical protein